MGKRANFTIKCEQLSGKLKEIYAKRCDEADYKSTTRQGSFCQASFHLNLYKNNDKLYFESETYRSIKANAFQKFSNIKRLSMSLSIIDKVEANTFKEFSNLKELSLNLTSKYSVINTNENELNCLKKIGVFIQICTFEIQYTSQDI